MARRVMIMVTKEAALDTPLMLNQIRQATSLACPVFDRFSASVPTPGIFDYLNSSMSGVQHPELYRTRRPDITPSTVC